MNDMQAFETHANAARSAIGKPPVRRRDDIRCYTTVIGELFAAASNADALAAQELQRIAGWCNHRQKMASWDAYGTGQR